MSDEVAQRGELSAAEYDAQWSQLSDFVKYNPGARHRRRLIGEAVAALPAPPRSVLDVGCGLGELIVGLSGRLPGATFSGIDISSVAVKHCRAAFPEGSFHLMDVASGHLDEQFDLLVCSEVTEHIADPQKALVNMAAMTRPGGHLILTTPHGRIHDTEVAIGHLLHPKRSQLRSWIDAAGFEVVRLRQWGWPAYTTLKYVGNVAPDKTLEHLGQGDYGPGVRRLNGVAYRLAGWFSLPTSPLGPQFVVTARRPTSG